MGRLADGAARVWRSVALKWIVLAALVVFAGAWGGLVFTRGSEQIATIWVANALLLALLFRTPTRLWIPLLAGGFLGSCSANLAGGYTVAISAGLALFNVLEVALVAVPMRRALGADIDLSRLRHLGAFVFLAALVAPAVSGVLAALMLAYAVSVPAMSIWALWYPADALGFLVFTPLLLMLRLDDLRRLARPEMRWQTLAWFTVLTVVTGFVFGQSIYPLLFLPMAVLGLVAVSLGPAATALGIGCVAVAATTATVFGSGR